MPRLRPTLVDVGEGPVLRLVRDPRDGKPLPAEGREVPLTAFWQRRLRDGDVEIAPEQAAGTDAVVNGATNDPAPKPVVVPAS